MLFNKIRVSKPKRNKFDLSHERKMSFKMGQLVPVVVQETIPGDSFRGSSEVFLRYAPLLAPVMHRYNVYVHYFFVPNRLVWNEWQEFITRGVEGTSTPIAPYFQIDAATAGAGLFEKGTLADYMGLPWVPDGASVDDPVNISALPFRAYQLVYNEYYRDQNLQGDLDLSFESGEVSGAELTKIMTMRNRCWEKDYFTSALPFAQRGPDVLLPVEGEGIVNYMPVSMVYSEGGSPALDSTVFGTDTDITDGEFHVNKANNESDGNPGRVENIDSVVLENGQTTINDFRYAVKLQEWFEKMARAGSRYIEQIFSMFGVKSSDARLQRPEYLGGAKQPVVVSEVLSTYQDPAGEGNPQGNMGGHAVSVGKGNDFKFYAEEHGYIIGIMSVLPRTAYQQGIPRHFRRFDNFDYYWPTFSHLGEQDIKRGEIYYDYEGSPGQSLTTWGYQSRYAEYKYTPSTVHGEFKDTLAFWHNGRIFDIAPGLNGTFVEASPEAISDRIFAVQDGAEHLYCQIYNRIDALRPMPYFGTPRL